MLRREVGVFGATMIGLGAIVGTGIFVSIGNAAALAGPAVILAIAVAGLVAAFNGLSSAQLAAAFPVSGGTYEYGYRLLHPSLGFTAGWMFICAKSASAATAALGFAAYLLNMTGQYESNWRIPVALLAVVILTIVSLLRIRRSSSVNIAIVCVTVLALIVFSVAGAPAAIRHASENIVPFFRSTSDQSNYVAALLEAIALMFVAYTGYGRVATLGEEVRDPQKNIPIAIISTLLISMGLYILVATVAIAALGADALAAATRQQAAPLEVVSRQFDGPTVSLCVAIGAMTSMLGVLLNLILGISRVVLAMSRRRDLPSPLARFDQNGTPYIAVLCVAGVIGILALSNNIKLTWSFSAFTVLIYYAITNLAAIRLPVENRRYHPALPWLGLCCCLSLAFWVDREVWMWGLALITVGLVWWGCARKVQNRK